MMKQEEADAVPMRMRWVHTEIMTRCRVYKIQWKYLVVAPLAGQRVAISAAEVYNYGWVYRDGSYVDDTTDGVRPALHLNLSSSNLYSYAGTVCSDAMKNGESGTDNPVNPSEPMNQIPQISPPIPTNREQPQEPEQRRAM